MTLKVWVHVLKVNKPALQILSMKVVCKPVLEVFLLQWQTVLVFQLSYTHTQQTCNDSNAITLWANDQLLNVTIQKLLFKY